ncbi:MAG: hypothetical protein H6865_07975 [Rhodospirillales bacterium]|nr:hypothetical protein [Alphaproteobacteria bacterium]MCB9987553.1 hypothetical protein [Rhodospirillales bacterium]USO07726.1 MAG: hypothetical protein H6866_00375 [Rhodospirillales bacterium]
MPKRTTPAQPLELSLSAFVKAAGLNTLGYSVAEGRYELPIIPAVAGASRSGFVIDTGRPQSGEAFHFMWRNAPSGQRRIAMLFSGSAFPRLGSMLKNGFDPTIEGGAVDEYFDERSGRHIAGQIQLGGYIFKNGTFGYREALKAIGQCVAQYHANRPAYGGLPAVFVRAALADIPTGVLQQKWDTRRGVLLSVSPRRNPDAGPIFGTVNPDLPVWRSLRPVAA